MGWSSGGGENNPACRKVKISGTTQPLWFYGFNLEFTGGDTEAEVVGASNVRFLGLKREGSKPLLMISNCVNIAAYGHANHLNAPIDNGFIQVLGASTNILLANLTIMMARSQPGLTGNTLYEAITGQPATNILWPNMVSLYKRGDIDDSLMWALPSVDSSALLAGQANPTNAGSVTGGGTYLVGSTNSLTAVASNGWLFVSWSDNETNNPRGVVVPANGASFTANFTSLTAPTLANPGIYASQFGFYMSGALNQTVVVEGCTNLTNPVWLPLQTNILHGSPAYYSEPFGLPQPLHFFRLRSQ